MFTARLLGGMSPMSWPSIRTWPSVGTSRPASMRSKVVLPQPEGPSSAKNSPGMISRLTLSTPTAEPHRFEMLRKLMMGLTPALAPSVVAWSTALVLYPLFCVLLCITIMRIMSAIVSTISMVDAALTSGVTEKRSIE